MHIVSLFGQDLCSGAPAARTKLGSVPLRTISTLCTTVPSGMFIATGNALPTRISRLHGPRRLWSPTMQARSGAT